MPKTREERREFWRGLIAQQEQSGQSVRAFCRQHRTSEYSFYQWRRRVKQEVAVKFALVEASRGVPASPVALELTLATGERLRIAPGSDVGMLRAVLSVLRERR